MAKLVTQTRCTPLVVTSFAKMAQDDLARLRKSVDIVLSESITFHVRTS
jgi:hypothetical protein